MARHLVAVCFVCIICAKHITCHKHTIDNEKPNRAVEKFSSEHLLIESTSIHSTKKSAQPPKTVLTMETNPKYSTLSTSQTSYHSPKTKRHANIDPSNGRNDIHHTFDDHFLGNGGDAPMPMSMVTKTFMRKLYKRFGNENSLTMSIDEFNEMLKHLGLHQLIDNEDYMNNDTAEHSANKSHIHNHDITVTNSGKPIINNNRETCISSVDLINLISPSDHLTNLSSLPITANHTINKLDRPSHSHPSTLTPDRSNETKGNETNTKRTKLLVDSTDMWTLCPILLYQMLAPTTLEQSGCIDANQWKISITEAIIDPAIGVKEEDEDVMVGNLNEMQNRTLVWVYASISLLVVSLSGLLGVGVIPFMDKPYYHRIIQFLVALAIGTLTGDALLHLLPHAMMTSSLSNPHVDMTCKGLLAAVGIVFFFIMERGFIMVAELHKETQKKEKPTSKVRVLRDDNDSGSNRSVAGNASTNPRSEKLCKHKYSSYPYCYDEIAMDTRDNHHHHNQDHSGDALRVIVDNEKPNERIESHEHYKNNGIAGSDVDETKLPERNWGRGLGTAVNGTKDYRTLDVEEAPLKKHQKELGDDDDMVLEENYTIILREHETQHHGHSHTHGHVHSPPNSLSSVAWMVVMGDGLHNFTDGMAIGAAFSNNIAGGFSTAIAVFCHELPHELGDFAVLLKAGMSAREAVYYNLLSSILSFFGMFLGIVVGDTTEASAWLFACAAGLFIYIALVDMMPELTSTHKKEGSGGIQILIQLVGMLMGLGIMLLIALYEDDLKGVFASSTDNHHHHHPHHFLGSHHR